VNPIVSTSHLQLPTKGIAPQSRDMATTSLENFASIELLSRRCDRFSSHPGGGLRYTHLFSPVIGTVPSLAASSEVGRSTGPFLVLTNGDSCTARGTMSHREDTSRAHLGWKNPRDEVRVAGKQLPGNVN
jgi:hypothetical protein